MIKNYFSTAINNLIKNKLYSAINIVGLAIGLAACIVIALYVQDESSYDKQWENSERIYRVNYSYNLPGTDTLKFAVTPLPLIPALHQYYSEEIELSTRTISFERIVDIDNAQYEDRLVSVDRPFIDMFQLEELAGSLENTLVNPSNVALSAEVASRYFGAQDPIGEVITISTLGVSQDFNVSAVYQVPGNTVLDVPLLSLLDEASLPPSLGTWFNANLGAYFLLKPGVDIESLKLNLPDLINQNVDISVIVPDPNAKASDVLSMDFQNIEMLHLDSPWDTTRAGGNLTVVIAFSAISVLILLIGGINFTILTTAKATQRAREVAMRKVLGARRKQLIVQFLGESFFIVLLAMILSLAVVELMLPIFESMVSKELAVDYSSPSTFLSLLALLLVVGLSGGLYPAFILSNFRPGSILKSNRSTETKGSASLRGILVIFQFSVSIILMIATSVIYTQLQYSNNRDPGFNKDNLLVINNIRPRPELRANLEPLKQELLPLANISNVGFSETQPSGQQQQYGVYTPLGGAGTNFTIARAGVGYDYFETYQIPLLAGRNYTVGRDIIEPTFDITTNDGSPPVELAERSIMINAGAVRALGFVNPEEAIGKVLSTETTQNTNYTIIGVVADNHIFSINALPRAEMYILKPDQANVVTVRFQGSPQAIIEQVNSIWGEVMGDIEISTVFVDQLLAEEFQQEQTEAIILISFSFLAILIACLGLFGSTSFTVDRRTKEIGLRKVMGAKVKNIVTLLIWQFSKPVLVANVIAWPVAVWAMMTWLQRFPYQINAWLLAPLCLVAGLIALSIAWLTVASNTTRVARSNPINALRYE
jgi:putative ABC transport system permease protein